MGVPAATSLHDRSLRGCKKLEHAGTGNIRRRFESCPERATVAKCPANLRPPVKQRVREFCRVWNGHRGEQWHFGTAPRCGMSNQRVDGRGDIDRGRRQKPFESCGFGKAHEKTPGTLALGVSCQPVGSESSLPNVRLSVNNPLRNHSRASRFRKSWSNNTL